MNIKNTHDILGITCPKNKSIWKYFHAKEEVKKSGEIILHRDDLPRELE